MRIDSGTVRMESSRSYAALLGSRRGWARSGEGRDGGRREAVPGSTARAEEKKGGAGERLSQIRERMQSASGMRKNSGVRSAFGATAEDALRDIREQCLNYLLELLFGCRGGGYGMEAAGDWFPEEGGEGYTLTEEKFYAEYEETTFSTEGTVNTADGRQISFGIELQMSRSFTVCYRRTVKTPPVNTCDPLVINLNGDVPEMTAQKFRFDLDGDGAQENISMPGRGSGFLALDRNGDGVVNDGGELFGTKSGDGFADLSACDSDGNGWIDEADPIFDRLLIWCKDENGGERLYRLREKGVGAICLSRTATDFSLKDEANVTKGIVRSTGFFLYEDGEAGTVQHLDVAR